MFGVLEVRRRFRGLRRKIKGGGGGGGRGLAAGERGYSRGFD